MVQIVLTNEDNIIIDSAKVDSKDHASLAMMNYIDSQREKDNFIGAKVAGKEIYTNLINWLKNDKGVHAETLLAVLLPLLVKRYKSFPARIAFAQTLLFVVPAFQASQKE